MQFAGCAARSAGSPVESCGPQARFWLLDFGLAVDAASWPLSEKSRICFGDLWRRCMATGVGRSAGHTPMRRATAVTGRPAPLLRASARISAALRSLTWHAQVMSFCGPEEFGTVSWFHESFHFGETWHPSCRRRHRPRGSSARSTRPSWTSWASARCLTLPYIHDSHTVLLYKI